MHVSVGVCKTFWELTIKSLGLRPSLNTRRTAAAQGAITPATASGLSRVRHAADGPKTPSTSSTAFSGHVARSPTQSKTMS